MAQLKRHCNYYHFHDSNAAFIRIFKGKLNLEEKPEAFQAYFASNLW